MNIIDQLNEKLNDYPNMVYKFEVIDSPEGIIVTIANRTPASTPLQYKNKISAYKLIISDCAPVSAEMIATYYAQNKKYERPQRVYVFAIQEK